MLPCHRLLCSLKSECEHDAPAPPTVTVEPPSLSSDLARMVAEDPGEVLRQLRAYRARQSLAEFVKQAWKETDPTTTLEWNWHHDALCLHLQRMFEDWESVRTGKSERLTIQNLAINVPPGTNKSRIVSVFFPAWAWLRCPGWSVICLSANPTVATRDAPICRNLIESTWYRETFQPTWTLDASINARDWYANTAGGSRRSFGIEAKIVGLRADCVAGETLVATEIGDIAIRDLHEMQDKPRVWSLNHDTGARELKRIEASRVIPNKGMISVRGAFGSLRCTPDHRVWTAECGYVRASDANGLHLRYLWDCAPAQDISDSACTGHVFADMSGVVESTQGISDFHVPLLSCGIPENNQACQHVFGSVCSNAGEPGGEREGASGPADPGIQEAHRVPGVCGGVLPTEAGEILFGTLPRESTGNTSGAKVSGVCGGVQRCRERRQHTEILLSDLLHECSFGTEVVSGFEAQSAPEEREIVAGGSLPYLQWTERNLPRQASAVQQVRDGNAHVRDLCETVSASGRGARQTPAPRFDEHVLLQGMHARTVDEPPGSIDTGLRRVQHDLSQQKWGPSVLLSEVPYCVCGSDTPDENSAREDLRGMQCCDSWRDVADRLLFQGVSESCTLEANARHGKLTLQSSEWLQRAISPDGPADPTARWSHVCGLQRPRAIGLDASGASHRSHTIKQRSEKSDHTVFPVPYDSPQVERTAVLSYERATVETGIGTGDVYDIQVEGNHNFFAGDILVHNCILLDDPNDAQTVHSEVTRESVNVRAWDQAIGNRLNNLKHGLRILIQQRLHDDDLTGHLLRQGGWVHLRIPLLYESKVDCPCPTCQEGCTPFGWGDPRTTDGEVIHPSRFPQHVIDAEMARLGSYGFAGQMQQRPAPEGGGIFKKAWFQYYENLPDMLDDVIIAADLANKKTTTGSFNVLMVLGKKGPWRYILDVQRNRGEWTTTDIQNRIRDLQTEWSKKTRRMVKILVEDKAVGPTVIQALVTELKLQGVIQDDEAQQARDDKVSRAMAVQPQVEGKNVSLPVGAPWVGPLLHELCTFPASANDDQVDTFTMGLNYWRGSADAERARWKK